MKKGLKRSSETEKNKIKLSERKLGICKENKRDLTYTYQTIEQMKQKKNSKIIKSFFEKQVFHSNSDVRFLNFLYLSISQLKAP